MAWPMRRDRYSARELAGIAVSVAAAREREKRHARPKYPTCGTEDRREQLARQQRIDPHLNNNQAERRVAGAQGLECQQIGSAGKSRVHIAEHQKTCSRVVGSMFRCERLAQRRRAQPAA